MRFALAQINTTVGDLSGNIDLIIEMARRALDGGAEVSFIPSLPSPATLLAICSRNQASMNASPRTEERLARQTADLDITLIYGSVRPSEVSTGKRAINVAIVLHGGTTVFKQTKMLLPTYDVFDEGRYFLPADRQDLLTLDGRHFALTVCEDAWNDKQFWEHRLYLRDPVEEMAQSGAEVLLTINASPYHMGKREVRRADVRARGRHHKSRLSM